MKSIAVLIVVLLMLCRSALAQSGIYAQQLQGITVDGQQFPARMQLVCTWAYPMMFAHRSAWDASGAAILFRGWQKFQPEPVTGNAAAALYPIYQAEYAAGSAGSAIVFEGGAGGLLKGVAGDVADNSVALGEPTADNGATDGPASSPAVGRYRMFIVVNPSGSTDPIPAGDAANSSHAYVAESEQDELRNFRVATYVSDSRHVTGLATPDEAWPAPTLFWPRRSLSQWPTNGTTYYTSPGSGAISLGTDYPTFAHFPLDWAVTKVTLTGRTINLYTSSLLGVRSHEVSGVQVGAVVRLDAGQNPSIPAEEHEYIFAKFEIVPWGTYLGTGTGGEMPDDCCEAIVEAVGDVEDVLLGLRGQFNDYYADWSTWVSEWRAWRIAWSNQDDFLQTKLHEILTALSATGNPTGSAMTSTAATQIGAEPLAFVEPDTVRDGLREVIQPLSVPTGSDVTTPPTWEFTMNLNPLGMARNVTFVVDFSIIDPFMPAIRLVQVFGVTLVMMQYVWSELRRQ